jgi:RHS repeat-associated protein
MGTIMSGNVTDATTWQRMSGWMVLLTLLVSVIGEGGAWAQIPAPPTESEVEYYHTDVIGSVRLVTNQAGQVTRRQDFTPYGTPISDVPTSAQPRGFAGKERDEQTGFDYFGARYLLAGTSRFTTVDPGHVGGDIFNPQSWNGYTYALNNPLRFVDPLGMEPCRITLGGADAAAAGVADGGTVEAECVRPKESWSDWFGRNISGLVPFTATLQAPGLGEADRPLVDESPDLSVSIAAAVVLPRALWAKGTTLAKMMQSEAGIAELLGGGGKVIAGVGSKVALRDVARLVSQYGGKAEDWVKISSTMPGLQTHAYRNIVTGVVVELKSKIPGF